MSNDKKSHPEPGLLLQYADDELSDADRKEILGHLNECHECRESVAELKSGVAEYKNTWMPSWKAAAEAPPKQWFEIRDELQKLDHQRAPLARRAWFDLRWAAAAAAAVFAVIVVYAIDGKLWFREDEIAEMVKVPSAPAPIPGATVKTADTSKPPAAIPDTVTPGDELRVWAALRSIDADLGEPIDVKRDSSRIVVTALGLSPQRRGALEGVLKDVPKVQVLFNDFQPVREAGQKPADTAPSRADSPNARIFAAEFIDSTLEAAQSTLLRAHALRKLADRYPPEIEAQLSTADRGLLQSLLAAHYDGFDEAARRVLDLARQITGNAAPQVSPLQPRSWQDYAWGLVDAAQAVDDTVTKLLADTGAPANQKALTAALDEATRRLESEMRRAR